MTCPTCTPAKRCESCERVAIVNRYFEHEADARELLAELDAHDRERLGSAEVIERATWAMLRHKFGASVVPNGGTVEMYRELARAALAAVTEAK